MMSWGSDETENGQTNRRSAGGLGRLSFGFGFERSKAWVGYDGPWAVIFVLVGGFAMKIGYPVLLVPDIVIRMSLQPYPTHTGIQEPTLRGEVTTYFYRL
jgi:hypothetical protein